VKSRDQKTTRSQLLRSAFVSHQADKKMLCYDIKHLEKFLRPTGALKSDFLAVDSVLTSTATPCN
jgi:hypothetical protein